MKKNILSWLIREEEEMETFLFINFVCRLILLNFYKGVKEFLRRTTECCVPEKCQLAIKTDIPWKEGMTKGKVK